MAPSAKHAQVGDYIAVNIPRPVWYVGIYVAASAYWNG